MKNLQKFKIRYKRTWLYNIGRIFYWLLVGEKTQKKPKFEGDEKPFNLGGLFKSAFKFGLFSFVAQNIAISDIGLPLFRKNSLEGTYEQSIKKEQLLENLEKFELLANSSADNIRTIAHGRLIGRHLGDIKRLINAPNKVIADVGDPGHKTRNLEDSVIEILTDPEKLNLPKESTENKITFVIDIIREKQIHVGPLIETDEAYNQSKFFVKKIGIPLYSEEISNIGFVIPPKVIEPLIWLNDFNSSLQRIVEKNWYNIRYSDPVQRAERYINEYINQPSTNFKAEANSGTPSESLDESDFVLTSNEPVLNTAGLGDGVITLFAQNAKSMTEPSWWQQGLDSVGDFLNNDLASLGGAILAGAWALSRNKLKKNKHLGPIVNLIGMGLLVSSVGFGWGLPVMLVMLGVKEGGKALGLWGQKVNENKAGITQMQAAETLKIGQTILKT